jgi:micrococcal nuclease
MSYRYNVKVTRIVDGDTVDVDIDLGFGMVYKKQRVRMMGIDTPESRTRDLEEKFYGKQSKYHLEDLLKDQKVQLQSHDKGKFGRILGELFIGESAFSVNQQMIKDYHAVPYFGQSKDETEQGHKWNKAALNEQGIIYEAK